MSEKMNLQAAFKLIQDNFAETLRAPLDDQERSLVDAKEQLFYMKAAQICLLEYRTLFSNDSASLNGALDFFEDLGFLSTRMRQSVSERIHVLEPLIDSWVSLITADFQKISIGDVYQLMLMQNIGIGEDGSYYLTNTKIQRDSSGSYYTPTLLAENVSTHAFRLVRTESGKQLSTLKVPNRAQLLNELSIADLSCGSGEFLRSAIKAAVNLGADLEKVLHNTWGYDVDPIALIIAFSEVLKVGSFPQQSVDVPRIAQHFVLGNTLIDSVDEGTQGSLDEKFRAYASGGIYRPLMGLTQDRFPSEGFDLIVGNPPWEKIRFEERKFFLTIAPRIAIEPNKKNREDTIAKNRNEDRKGIYDLYDVLRQEYSSVRQLLMKQSSFDIPPGELNTYLLFCQLTLSHLSKKGSAAQLLRAAFATAANNSIYFSSILQDGQLQELHLFSNRERIFPIDSRERFCVAFFGQGETGRVLASFGNDQPIDFLDAHCVEVRSESLERVNPLTRMIPDVESSTDLQFLLDAHDVHPTFAEEYPASHFGRLVHFTNHSSHISRTSSSSNIGVFEGKFIGRHDLRFSTFQGMEDQQVYSNKARSRKMTEEEKLRYSPQPRFFIDKDFWNKMSRGYSEPLMVCWRSLTSPTNERTMIAALSPFRPSSQSVQFLQNPNLAELLITVGLFNSIPFDGFIRLKMPGIDLTQSVVRQIPVPTRSAYGRSVDFSGISSTLGQHIFSRVAALYRNEPEVVKNLQTGDLGFFEVSGSREELISELDDLFFEAYGFSEKEKEFLRAKFRK